MINAVLPVRHSHTWTQMQDAHILKDSQRVCSYQLKQAVTSYDKLKLHVLTGCGPGPILQPAAVRQPHAPPISSLQSWAARVTRLCLASWTARLSSGPKGGDCGTFDGRCECCFENEWPSRWSKSDTDQIAPALKMNGRQDGPNLIQIRPHLF